MRKHVFGRQLQRDINERKALFKSLMSSLIVYESIKTTEAKAKAVKAQVEKMVTKTRKNADESKRMLQGYFTKPILEKFVSDITPRFAERPGGYTRIVKLGNRLKDNARMVILEWVEKPIKVDIISPDSKDKASKSIKKVQASVKIKKEDSAKQNLKNKKSEKKKYSSEGK